jgi:hypothetical protein
MLLTSPNLPITFSQGDDAVLTLQAVDNQGNPVDITGASFSTQILGPNNTGAVTFPNGQHAITNAAQGLFELTLSETDTANCSIGNNKDIVTLITIAGLMASYHGASILEVEASVPLQ